MNGRFEGRKMKAEMVGCRNLSGIIFGGEQIVPIARVIHNIHVHVHTMTLEMLNYSYIHTNVRETLFENSFLNF